jgi:hypothetical protein
MTALNDLSSRPPLAWLLRSNCELLARHSHAQPLAIEGQKKNGGTIYGSRRSLDLGNRRRNLDGNDVVGLTWISAC